MLRKNRVMIIFVVLAALAALVTSACSSGSNEPKPRSVIQNVGTDGGTVAIEDNAVTVTVPAGALAEATELSISERLILGTADFNAATFTDVDGNDITMASSLWEFSPEGLEFSSPVTVTITYDETLAAGKTLALFWTKLNDRSVFEVVGNATFASGVCTAQVTHFSLAGVGFLTEATQDGDIDEEEEQEQEEVVTLPENLVVSPAADATGVSLNAVVSLVYNDALPAGEVLDASIVKSGETTAIDGVVKYSLNGKSWFFLPKNLWEPDTTYELSFTWSDSKTYTVSFTTVASAGSIAMAGGNTGAAARGENQVAFLADLATVEIVEPADRVSAINSIIAKVLSGENDFTVGGTPMGAPLNITGEGDVKDITFAYADAMDFNDDDVREVNHTASSWRLEGAKIRGEYFLYNGTITLKRGEWGPVEYQNLELVVDNLFMAGRMVLDGGKVTFKDMTFALYVNDCSTFKNFWHENAEEIGLALAGICELDVPSSLFALATFDAKDNAITKATGFTLEATAEALKVSWTGKLDAKYKHLTEGNAYFRVYNQSGDLVLTSENYIDNLTSDYATWDQLGANYFQFNTAIFNLPADKLTAGTTYKLDFSVSMWGYIFDTFTMPVAK